MTEPTAVSDATPDARLAVLADEAWQAHLAANPLDATMLGDHSVDALLRPNGSGALTADLDRLAALIDRAQAIEPAGLSADGRVTQAALLDFLVSQRELVASGIEAWIVDPLDGPQVQLLNVPSYQSVTSIDLGEALVQRWREMGPWMDRRIATMRLELANGSAAPAALVRSVLAELDDLLAQPVEDWPLTEPARAVPPDWPAETGRRFAADVRSTVADGILPAFARYRAFLAAEILPVARADDRPGLGALAGGEAAYAHLVRAHTTLELTPDAIHRIGLEEIERLDEEFRALGAVQLGQTGLDAILERLRSDPALSFATGDEVLAVAEGSLARASAAIDGWFGRLPRTPCVVVAMGDHEARHSTIAYYRDPAGDGSRPGRYYVNTTEPTTRPRYEAEVLAFHEAVPGHHLQVAIAQELDGLPAFRRYAGPTAFVEGWGLYAERLADEMGLYSGPLDQFGILSFDAWRACRLVVDTGLHALGWSRDAAIAFMLEHTALAPNNIVNEVDRYLALPGQALAYKLGQRELLGLRRQAQDALGAAFDIRTFHDVVLGQGAVGLATLRLLVSDWVARPPG